ncbi:hypothetical protein KFK09_025183 [Dendrobium nobile]|uniref:Uncharacterized protein n=1 Tax=Dendrobium nobile TaxID=94219 RepID=A0A8T3AES0_DENNO|nr:hypothetical protein KFK09_025183 [Dendrobium nobile]
MSKQPLAFKISLPKLFLGLRRIGSFRSVPPRVDLDRSSRPFLRRHMRIKFPKNH